MSKMKQLMKGLPDVTIRAWDLDREKHFTLRYEPEPERYYVNMFGIDEATFDGVYGSIRWVRVSIDAETAPLLPGHILLVLKLMRGISFNVTPVGSYERRLRWSHGTVETIDPDGSAILNEDDWLDVAAGTRYEEISMVSLVEDHR